MGTTDCERLAGHGFLTSSSGLGHAVAVAGEAEQSLTGGRPGDRPECRPSNWETAWIDLGGEG